MVRLANICVGFAFVMSISCCLSTLSLHWVPNTNAVSGGIWAYVVVIHSNYPLHEPYIWEDCFVMLTFLLLLLSLGLYIIFSILQRCIEL